MWNVTRSPIMAFGISILSIMLQCWNNEKFVTYRCYCPFCIKLLLSIQDGPSLDEPKYDLTRATKTAENTATNAAKTATLAQVHRPPSSNSSGSGNRQALLPIGRNLGRRSQMMPNFGIIFLSRYEAAELEGGWLRWSLDLLLRQHSGFESRHPSKS
jgi:hypothetical protein